MRIFHVITLSSVGGAQSVVVNLANEQIKRHEVYIISSADGEAWKTLDPRIKTIGISQLRRNISWRDGIVLCTLLYYRIKYAPDIVHLHSSKMGALGRIAFSPRKIIYTVHGFDSIRIAHRPFLKLEQSLQNRCAHIVGVSKYDERNLKNEGIDRHVCCIHNGIRDTCGEDSPAIFTENTRLLFDDIHRHYSKIVMTIARDDPPKRMDLFLETASRLPRYAFVWIGNTRNHTSPPNAFLLGQFASAQYLLAYADLFMLPSDYEGMPMSVIEALSYGKPVVASEVGGISELLDGTNGYAVENTVEQFTRNIERILTDPVLHAHMGQMARKTYETGFTIEEMNKAYDCLYNTIIRKS